jgi:arsenite methyltransferase
LQACTVIVLLNRGRDPDSFSTGLTEMIATYVTGRGGISRGEALAWAQDVDDLGDDAFFSLNRYLFVATARA